MLIFYGMNVKFHVGFGLVKITKALHGKYPIGISPAGLEHSRGPSNNMFFLQVWWLRLMFE